jgi:Integrase core domain
MQLWQMDVMGGLVLADGGKGKLVTGIDDHSRFCVAAGVIQRATARAVCRVFTAALARHGIPRGAADRQRQGVHRPLWSQPW